MALIANIDVQNPTPNIDSRPLYFPLISTFHIGNGSTPDPVTLLNMQPAVGSDLLATQAVTFELQVVPPALLSRAIVWVIYPDLNGQTEVVYDGTGFTSAFDGSGRTVDTLTVDNKFLKRKFTVLRNGGWPSHPRIFVHANTDLGGTN